MRDPKDFQFNLPAEARPAAHPLREKIHVAAWAAAPECASVRPEAPASAIRAIVIHATAGASTEGAVSVMVAHRASFHWLVADEDEAAHGDFIWASAPEARAAWHVRNNCSHPEVYHGARRVNDWSLGIEIVNAQSGGDGFSDWQLRATAQIVRYAWAKYPNLAHVVSHARLDPARRTDPGSGFPWERFRALTLCDQRLRTTNRV
jgi:N-acetylmuramoyl-L-alanine amidase